MTIDTILIGIGILLLLAVGLMWVWNHLIRQVSLLKSVEKELIKMLAYRRDVIPYLLESYRGAVTPEATHQAKIQKLITQRTEARNTRLFREVWPKEKVLEKELMDFIQENAKNALLEKDIGWLESRTELQQVHQTLEDYEARYNELTSYLGQRFDQFPYSLFRASIQKRL